MNLESETQRGTDNKFIKRDGQDLKSDVLTVSETQTSSPHDPSSLSSHNNADQFSEGHNAAESIGRQAPEEAVAGGGVAIAEFASSTPPPSINTPDVITESDDVVVMMNGRVLQRPPLPPPPQHVRSATPIRILYDPIRAQLRRNTRFRSQSMPATFLQDDDMDSSILDYFEGGLDGLQMDNFIRQRARLRTTRNPMFDGDSQRNMPERRFFVGNNEVGSTIQFITRGHLSRAGMFQAHSQLLAREMSARSNGNGNNNRGVNNDNNAAYGSNADNTNQQRSRGNVRFYVVRRAHAPELEIDDDQPNTGRRHFRRVRSANSTFEDNAERRLARLRPRRRLSWNRGAFAPSTTSSTNATINTSSSDTLRNRDLSTPVHQSLRRQGTPRREAMENDSRNSERNDVPNRNNNNYNSGGASSVNCVIS